MQNDMIEIFQDYPTYAIFLSLIFNIIISLLGVVPSVFLTAANLIVFGFWEGMLLSAIGESLGAFVSFLLYRKGFRRFVEKKKVNHRYLEKLLTSTGSEAFLLILSLRILPFIPSGMVTLTAAVGKVSLLTFVIASTVGKLPALFLEAYSVYQIFQWNTEAKFILGGLALMILIFILRKSVTKQE